MKKSILVVAILVISMTALAQKPDTVKQSSKKEAPKPAPKLEYQYNVNKQVDLKFSLSPMDIYLLSMTDQDWFALKHSKQPVEEVTANEERLQDLKKSFKKLNQALNEADYAKWRADTTAAGKKPLKIKK